MSNNAKEVRNRFTSWKPNEDDLDFWLKTNQNVLMCGHAGVGKTSLIVETFKRNKVSFSTFSAPTLDPFLDFRGIPTIQEDKKGKFVDMVMMKELRDKDPEFIFIDEFNRGNKTIRNAVMELVLNKSINGKKLKNLRAIWTGVNPDDIDTNYDVEPLDPAQEDRFQIRVLLQKVLHKPYFVNKYSQSVYSATNTWWDNLSSEQRETITPRRVDFALDYKINHGGDLSHILPPCTKPDVLLNHLANGTPIDVYDKLMKNPVANEAALRKFFANKDNFEACKKTIIKQPDALKYVGIEDLTVLLSNAKVLKYVMVDYPSEFMDVIRTLQNSTDPVIKQNADSVVNRDQLMRKAADEDREDEA